MALEIGVKSIPSVFFLLFGTIRFVKIRPIGFASRITAYSNFYISKMAISILMVSLYFVVMCIILGLSSSDACSSAWYVVYHKQIWSLVYIVNIVAWIFSALLMRYEYRKRLSEGIYSH